jgi:hypothetical protein
MDWIQGVKWRIIFLDRSEDTESRSLLTTMPSSSIAEAFAKSVQRKFSF